MHHALYTTELIERIIYYLDSEDMAACVGVWKQTLGANRVRCSLEEVDVRFLQQESEAVGDLPFLRHANEAHSDCLLALQQISVHVVSLLCASYDNELFAAVSRIFIPLAGNLKRLTIYGLTNVASVWLDRLLPGCTALEELVLYDINDSHKFTLPAELTQSLRILEFSPMNVLNQEQIGRYELLQDVTIHGHYLGSLDHLKQLRNLTALGIEYDEDKWGGVAAVLSTVGGQLKAFRLHASKDDDPLRAKVVQDIIHTCQNLETLRVRNFKKCSSALIQHLVEGLPHLGALSLDETPVLPDRMGKMSLDSVIQHRTQKLTVFFDWAHLSLKEMEEIEKEWNGTTLCGCKPLGHQSVFWSPRSRTLYVPSRRVPI
ncbi:hypothetical protein HDU93_009810 [Gonapodya sp. JEL0774]|nr:hypothetical protein HDU93_009810 [Gonapodya sp. JEL0774]